MAKRKKAATMSSEAPSGVVESIEPAPTPPPALVEKKRKRARKKIVPPVFELWNGDTKLVSSGNLEDTASYNLVKDNSTQLLKINHNGPIPLPPLTLVTGPLKGRYVLKLQLTEVTNCFRFTDLPPELRRMVYECLFNEPGGVVTMRSHRIRNQGKRIMRDTFSDHHSVPNGKPDEATQRLTQEAPSSYAILRASSQLRHEAAPIAYGNNKFVFTTMSETDLWLDGVGSMRRHLRYVAVGEQMSSKYRSIYNMLKDAKHLQILEINHRTICGGAARHSHERMDIQKGKLVHQLKPLLRVLHRTKECKKDVLDIIKVICTAWCYRCLGPAVEVSSPECTGIMTCKTPCRGREAHAKALTAEVRTLVAEALGIEE